MKRDRKKIIERYKEQSKSEPVLDDVQWWASRASILCLVLIIVALQLPDAVLFAQSINPIIKWLLIMTLCIVVFLFIQYRKR